jgi:hypothetical protein
MEVQVRTHAMHRDAELGIAAHWRYKEGGGAGGDWVTWLKGFLAADGTDGSDRVRAPSPPRGSSSMSGPRRSRPMSTSCPPRAGSSSCPSARPPWISPTPCTPSVIAAGCQGRWGHGAPCRAPAERASDRGHDRPPRRTEPRLAQPGSWVSKDRNGASQGAALVQSTRPRPTPGRGTRHPGTRAPSPGAG